jgi:murein DD-endopeptidase MepM/ murein hydrolase activator NlpD
MSLELIPIALALALSRPLQAGADPPVTPPDRADTPEWEAIRKRVSQDRVKTSFLRREESSILFGLEKLDRALADGRRKSAEIVDQIRRTEVKIQTLDQGLRKSEQEILELRAKAARRAAAMHRIRRTRLTDLFSKVTSTSELRKLRDRMRIVLAYDGNLISSVHRASDAARSLRAELKEKQAALETDQAALAKEAEATTTLREDRAQLLEAVRHERGASERLGQELLAAAKHLEKEMGVMRGAGVQPDAAPGGFEAQMGKLPWPATGRVEVPFGKKVDPASGMVMVQKGIDIRAPVGTPVRAIFSGTVVFSSWFEGFGRMVIVDHGGGYYSLYAHLEDLEVQKAQRLNQHQVIGLVGDSGSTKGAYLYLEIRRGKDAVDPLKWLVP